MSKTVKETLIERGLKYEELTAELERVKTDLKNTIEAGKIVVRNELAAQAELASLKSRLPVNADGDVVLWGDPQEYTYGEVARVEAIEKCPHPVNGIRDRWKFEFDNEDYDYADNCHTTSESCRGAE